MISSLLQLFFTQIIKNKCVVETIPAECSVAFVVSDCKVQLFEFCRIRNSTNICQNVNHGLVEIGLSDRVLAKFQAFSDWFVDTLLSLQLMSCLYLGLASFLATFFCLINHLYYNSAYFRSRYHKI